MRGLQARACRPVISRGTGVYEQCSHRGTDLRIQAALIHILKKCIPISKQNGELHIWTPDRLKYIKSHSLSTQQAATQHHCASGDVLKLTTMEGLE